MGWKSKSFTCELRPDPFPVYSDTAPQIALDFLHPSELRQMDHVYHVEIFSSTKLLGSERLDTRVKMINPALLSAKALVNQQSIC